MFSTILVYLMLTCMMLLFNTISSYQTSCINKNVGGLKSNIPILAILIFSIVFGIRYNVGIDHLRYIEAYDTLRIRGEDHKGTELGFLLIGKIFASLNFHYSWYFAFLAFLQLFLLCYAFRYHYKVIGWIIVTFMLSTTFLNFMNGIRQELAFCFQTVALYYLSKKNFLGCYIHIGLAILFHSSAVLLLPLPLLYIRKNNYINKIPVQISLFFIFLICSIILKPAVFLFTALMDFLEIFGYGGYKYMVLGGDLSFLEPKREAGIGFLLVILINLINISQSNKVKGFHSSRFLNLIYDFYFVGVLYYFVASGSIVLGRINYYFYNFSFIISAFTIYYFVRNVSKKNTLLLMMLMIAYIGIFGAVIILRGKESCAIYNTCF